MLSMVTADYILQVRTHYYNNPHNRLANGDCCRTPLVIFTQGRCTSCNNRFYYCLQSIDSTRSDCIGGITSDISNEDIQFSNPTLLGLPNPLPLQGLTRQWNVSLPFENKNLISILFSINYLSSGNSVCFRSETCKVKG